MSCKFVPMPDRIHTFEVQSEAGTIGYVRHVESGDLIARTLGDKANAADIRRFQTPEKAVRWLMSEHPATRRAQVSA